MIFLFIVFSISGEAFPSKRCLNKNENAASIFSTPAYDQEKSQLTQLEGIIYTPFRLTENTAEGFQIFENTNILLQRFTNKQLLISQKRLSQYAEELKQLRCYPIYIRYRRLLI